ncbi:MAG: 3-deoxy-8-phosphooctulonate synthase [Cohaesibacteraceae bacterium]|nr:3-deoxy-8-phosphooctulonate synthase [Cohaesibacteraceae bacterium]MBL4875207.1 3-deoxy-8-phosphooctulonate synthase [Cohaesibacteraceae bacterium]
MTGSKSDVTVGSVTFSNKLPFVLIAGPCQMETRDHAFEMASAIKEITDRLGIPLIYKSSFDKANRSSISGKRGIGFEKGLEVFAELKNTFGFPVITDVHEVHQCVPVANVCDILQIPAFLCRQTDLVVAAAKTGAVLNIKKGQFAAPWDMKYIVEKATRSGNSNILLTERGASFGYNALVTDMRSLPIMAEEGTPVIFDATHSVQQPGGKGGSTGGQREFVPVLSKAALATGISGLFLETHQDPDTAPSDGPNMVPLDKLEAMLVQFKAIDDLVKSF